MIGARAILGSIDDELRSFEDDTVGRDLIVDVSGVTDLDTAGAMVFQRILNACNERGDISGISKGRAKRTPR